MLEYLTVERLWAVQRFADWFYGLYRQRGGRPHVAGARDPQSVRMHWSREWEYPWVLEQVMGAPSPGRLIDLGCGGSPWPLWWAENGHDVLAVDQEDVLTGPTVSLRRYGNQSVPPTFTFLQTDLRDLNTNKVPDQSYDVVSCISVLESEEALATSPKFTAMLHRVLRPGGLFIATIDVGRPNTWISGPDVLVGYVMSLMDQGFEPTGSLTVTPPPLESLPGTYHVAGISLRVSTCPPGVRGGTRRV